MMRKTFFWLVTLSLISFVACSDDKTTKTTDSGTGQKSDATVAKDVAAAADQATTTPDEGIAQDSSKSADSQAKTAEPLFKDVAGYDALKGTVTLKPNIATNVTKVELLVNGKSLEPALVADKSPFELALDTTKLTDGLVKLSYKSTVGTTETTSAELTLVVLNNGVEATLDKNSALISIPASGAYAEQHLKYHWIMPESIKTLIGVMSWDTIGFKLELKTGLGECPDANPTGVKKWEESNISPMGVEFHEESGTLQTGQWYLHVSPKNVSEMSGKSTTFKLKVYLIK